MIVLGLEVTRHSRESGCNPIPKLGAVIIKPVVPAKAGTQGFQSLAPGSCFRAGLSGESEAVARPRSCATREDPRGRTWSGHPRLRCGDCGCLKTWMPGTSPGKGLWGAKFGTKPTHGLPSNCPRTALRGRGDPGEATEFPGFP